MSTLQNNINSIDTHHQFHNNEYSNLVQKMAKFKEYKDYFNKNEFDNYPDQLDYNTRLNPTYKSTTGVPDSVNDYYTFNIPDYDFLTGMSLRITTDNTYASYPYPAIALFDRIVIEQYKKCIWNFNTKYILGQINELNNMPEIEFYETIMNGINNGDGTYTYILPVILPLLKKNGILLDFHKGLSITFYFSGATLTGITSFSPILEIYRTSMIQDVKNSYINKIYKNPSHLANFFHYNTFSKTYTIPSTSSDYVFYIEGNYSIKNIYFMLQDNVDSNFYPINNHILKLSDKVIDSSDIFGLTLRKINKINGKCPWNWDQNSYCVTFGLYDKQAYSGSLLTTKEPISITLGFPAVNNASTLYVCVEYINTLFSNEAGLLDSTKET